MTGMAERERRARGLAIGVLLLIVWLFAAGAVAGGLVGWVRHPGTDPFDNGAWLAGLLLGLFTIFITTMLGLFLEGWPRVAVLRLVPPAVTLALIIGLAWAVPSRQPRAGKVLLDVEAALATLCLGAIARSWWRGLGRRDLPSAIVSPRR